MSATSGPTSPPPFAFYDPESRSLRTSQGTFDGDSTPSCVILPTSGSMSSGALRARRRSALPTFGGASSSSPLLPTPRTSDTNGSGTHGDGGPDLRTAVSLLPTPTASFPGTTANYRPDGTPYGTGYGMTLLDAARLLPTPRASDTGTPGRRASEGFRPPLSQVILPLLPTPVASDGDRHSDSYSRGNPTLKGALLPTPRASDGEKGGPNQRGSKGDLALTAAAHRIGASTPQPSTAGSALSDGQLPGQLTIDDA